jgi:hypothetical protein
MKTMKTTYAFQVKKKGKPSSPENKKQGLTKASPYQKSHQSIVATPIE